MKSALVVWGGLELHEPEKGAHVVREILEAENFKVTVTDDYTALGADGVGAFDLIVPQITGGELDREHSIRFCSAIEAGTGLAGFHHALATTFPGNPRMRFLGGSTFATHPGDIITYRVDPKVTSDPIMAGIGSFEHTSEQYYMHVDPTVEVLATTTFSGEHAFWKKGVEMPVVYKSAYGNGRVFYTALGHKPAELDKPEIRTILTRGLLWAAR
ncbi:ThuA domain-containing protein [Devosia sp. ZB163]|uniref:ThuA domain-containing protein n=1 Tax=Devosia sp. ZB163 TaxID=3025938 RepID=UPI0023606302|nr:ThuA domain-containing protein [Devosia sp. ZB163]MDC9823429.1 ThuA domain-containing protein [Devosia sp. ZB163]